MQQNTNFKFIIALAFLISLSACENDANDDLNETVIIIDQNQAGTESMTNDEDCADDSQCSTTNNCNEESDGVDCMCMNQQACEDGIDCTIDECDANFGCTHRPDNSMCNTDELCMSFTCDPNQGCVSEPVNNCCGNGIIEGLETCDDGNLTNEDGCSSICRVELSCPESCVVLNTVRLPQSQHIPMNALGYDRFGSSLAANEDYMVVGAIERDEYRQNNGSVYVYKRQNNEWVYMQKLRAPDGARDDKFGNAVSISGTTIAIGAFGHDAEYEFMGAVYIYTLNNEQWAFEQKLLPDDGGQYDGFGRSLSLLNDTLVIGSPEHKSNRKKRGASYVYKRMANEWSLLQKLLPEGYAEAECGSSVALFGTQIAVGCPRDTYDNYDNKGSIYIYNLNENAWDFSQKITLDLPYNRLYFGLSVALHDNYLAAWHNEDRSQVDGVVYIYKKVNNIWRYEQMVYGRGYRPFGIYGTSVSINNDTLVVGSPRHDAQDLIDSGSVHVYKRNANEWSQVLQLNSHTASALDSFGRSVFILGDQLLVGSDQQSTSDNHRGSVYTYDLSEPIPACNDNGQCLCRGRWTGADCSMTAN